MEDVHREILRRNHSMLVREMSPDLVADQLYSDCIFTPEMKETVSVQMTKFAKSRKILEYLPRRGKKAFHLFCQALEKSNQTHLALQLRQDNNSAGLGSTSYSSQTNNRPPLKKFTQLCMLHLGDNVYVTANLSENFGENFGENVVQIHIRQYDEGSSKPYPTKKGITMSMTEWLLL
jgi:hypothetical protein